MTQTTNESGLKLIKSFEGCKLKAYKLEGENYFTIGYGHSFDKSITANTVWTQEQADNALKKDLKKFEAHVLRLEDEYNFKFNDNQFAALVSYCYNRGPGGLEELFKHSNMSNMADNIVKYWGSAERFKDGLINRRKKEKELFLKGTSQSTPKPAEHPKTQVKSISQLADEVLKGLHGSGRERMISLGSNYAKVQAEVNKRLRS